MTIYKHESHSSPSRQRFMSLVAAYRTFRMVKGFRANDRLGGSTLFSLRNVIRQIETPPRKGSNP